MIFNLVWLPARQTGSSIRTKVLLRIMLRDTTVCEDDLVKQALRQDAQYGLLLEKPVPANLHAKPALSPTQNSLSTDSMVVSRAQVYSLRDREKITSV